MTTQPNPFHVQFEHGKGRTLAEIETATRNPSGLPSQPARPSAGLANVSEWLSRQGVHLCEEDFVKLDEPSRPQPSRHDEAFVRQSVSQPASGRLRDKAVNPVTFMSPSCPVPHTPPSSRRVPSNRLKRKAPSLDDSEEDVIVVQTPPGSWSWGPRTAAEVVDLTKRNLPRRKTSFLGNQDDDVIIIDPPAAEMRRELRPLVIGRPRSRPSPCIQPSRRSRQTQTELRSALAESVRHSIPQESPLQTVEPEASTTDASALLQSIESVTHFFTLAVEIRDKIYRYLLVSPKPIHVQHLWTEPARRPTRRGGSADDVDTKIETGILSVCRRTATEGMRILYSENRFLYLLRDPEAVWKGNGGAGRRSQRVAAKGLKDQERHAINLAKYGHLIRHMAIEVEPNRTGPLYEKLMSAALKALVPAAESAGLRQLPSLPQPLRGRIHLHTLTITVSPLFESSHRTVRAPALANQDAIANEGRFLSTAGFFSRGSSVLNTIQRINVDFLCINVHVNADTPWGDDLSADELDFDSGHSDASTTHTERPKKRHLETTIDLRYLPRHMQGLNRDGPLGELWANDPLMQEKRRRQGIEAEKTLLNLRRHIEDACLRPLRALRRGGLWEEHSVAERQRREKRAKEEAWFDADAYAGEDSDNDDGGRATRGVKSLIISIDRVGNELRAYRA